MYDIALDGKLLSDIINSKTTLWNILLKSLTRKNWKSFAVDVCHYLQCKKIIT